MQQNTNISSTFSKYCTGYCGFGFNGQEKDQEIYNNQSTTTAMFWEYDGRIGRRWNLDPKQTVGVSDYATFGNNPIMNVDVKGDSVWLFATRLPNASSFLNKATHTFIIVKTKDNKLHYFVYGPKKYKEIFGSSPLIREKYSQDKEIYEGKNVEKLKLKEFIEPPKGMTMDEFDKKVINTAERFGDNPGITYHLFTSGGTTGNCNSSTYTILSKSGVSEENLNKIEEKIPGIHTGFGKKTAWTPKEQDDAIKSEKAELYKKISKWENNTGGSK